MTDLRRQTQSDTVHGNCWQTGVACILGVPAAELPDQVAVQGGNHVQGKSYHNALNAYLDVHHGRMYSELFGFQLTGVLPREPGFHLLVGPTERTPVNGMNHVVVAHYGEPFWDVHPSRAGLTKVERWGIVAPLPDWLRQERAEKRAAGESAYVCICPRCA